MRPIVILLALTAVASSCESRVGRGADAGPDLQPDGGANACGDDLIPCAEGCCESTSQTVDDLEPSNANAIALDEEGRPHIAYLYRDRSALRYARWTGSQWAIDTIDSSGNLQNFVDLAIDGEGHRHVAYYDAEGVTLKHAYYDGESWEITDVAEGGLGLSLALDSLMRPHIAYSNDVDTMPMGLNHAWLTDDGWQTDEIEATYGLSTSIQVDPQDRPHVSYKDLPSCGVKYAAHDGADWQIELALEAGGCLSAAGGDTALGIDSSGSPHVACVNAELLTVEYLSRTGDSWASEKVADVGQFAGDLSGVLFDGQGNPVITFTELVEGSLQLGHRLADGWSNTIVEELSESSDGFNSLVIDSSGAFHVSYQNEGELRYARR